jgi:protein TonB
MRTYTILFSIAAHTLALFAIVVITVTATDVRPDPRRASEVVIVRAEPPKPPPVAPRARPPVASAPSRDAAPIDAPRGIEPEPPRDDIGAPTAPPGSVIIGSPVGDIAAEPPPPPPPPPPPLRSPIRAGGDVRRPQKVYGPAPVYPAIAQSARVSGVVVLEAVIAEDGSVRDVRVLRSIPLLDQAAIDAVRQWRFTPTLLDGQPIAIVMTVTVGFDLH